MSGEKVHSLLRKSWRTDIENGIGNGENERKYRERIRNRARVGLYDIAILNQYASSKDIELIFNDSDGHNAALPNELLPSDELRDTHWVPAMHMVSLLWRGLRSNGMDKQEVFRMAIRDGIVRGEAEYKQVDMSNVEYDLSLNTLEAHTDTDEFDPLEKWKRGLGLTGDEYQELTNKLSEHPEVDEIIGKELGTLIEKHLIDDPDE